MSPSKFKEQIWFCLHCRSASSVNYAEDADAYWVIQRIRDDHQFINRLRHNVCSADPRAVLDALQMEYAQRMANIGDHEKRSD